MDLIAHIAEHILEVYEGDNWTEVTVKKTLSDVSLREATTISHASPNTIASIIFHMRFYNDIILQRCRGIAPGIDATTNGFNVHALTSQDEWEALKEDCGNSFKALHSEVVHMHESHLWDTSPNANSPIFKQLIGITEHNYYHLGQIVIIKNLIRHSNA